MNLPPGTCPTCGGRVQVVGDPVERTMHYEPIQAEPRSELRKQASQSGTCPICSQGVPSEPINPTTRDAMLRTLVDVCSGALPREALEDVIKLWPANMPLTAKEQAQVELRQLLIEANTTLEAAKQISDSIYAESQADVDS